MLSNANLKLIERRADQLTRNKHLNLAWEDIKDLCKALRESRQKVAELEGRVKELEDEIDDPDPGCEWDECNGLASCGTPYQNGYLRVCGDHFSEINKKESS